MITDRHYLTKDGLKKLQNELVVLVEEKRPEIADRLREAASYGDLSENAEYKEAKEAQGFLEGRIKDVQIILSDYEIIKGQKNVEMVVLGSEVRVRSKNTKGLEVFLIVGPQEADPVERKISYESPLGRSLMGSAKGDEVEVETPGGIVKYIVIEIK